MKNFGNSNSSGFGQFMMRSFELEIFEANEAIQKKNVHKLSTRLAVIIEDVFNTESR